MFKQLTRFWRTKLFFSYFFLFLIADLFSPLSETVIRGAEILATLTRIFHLILHLYSNWSIHGKKASFKSQLWLQRRIIKLINNIINLIMIIKMYYSLQFWIITHDEVIKMSQFNEFNGFWIIHGKKWPKRVLLIGRTFLSQIKRITWDCGTKNHVITSYFNLSYFKRFYNIFFLKSRFNHDLTFLQVFSKGKKIIFTKFLMFLNSFVVKIFAKNV